MADVEVRIAGGLADIDGVSVGLEEVDALRQEIAAERIDHKVDSLRVREPFRVGLGKVLRAAVDHQMRPIAQLALSPLPGRLTVPITFAPFATASCVTASPTAPPMACTRTVSPALKSVGAVQQVIGSQGHTTGKAAPVRKRYFHLATG